jgi:tetratricopeptide (TPR) repeat protein
MAHASNPKNQLDPSLTESQALEWARRTVPFNAHELVSRWPWATTYRVTLGGTHAYLKILAQPVSAQHTTLIVEQFASFAAPLMAVEASRGWLLSADHGGQTLDYDAGDDSLMGLILAGAQLEALAARKIGSLSKLPRSGIEGLTKRLLAFLEVPHGGGDSPDDADDLDEPDPTPPVHAAYFVGRSASARYHRLLAPRMAMLDAHLAPAGSLRPTLSHGDFRPPNAALLPDGTYRLIDWDDASIAPAGWSLHGLFESCTLPTIFLASTTEAAQRFAQRADARRINDYARALEQAGYADMATLRQALPASMCGGMIEFILNFANHPSPTNRRDVADTLSARLSDLLNLTDWLASRDPKLAREWAEDYVAQGESRRGRQLLQDQVAKHPEDVAVLARFAEVSLDNGDHDIAAEAYAEALARAPERAELHAGLARAKLELLELDTAFDHYAKAMAVAPDSEVYRVGLEHAREMRDWHHEATQPQTMPRIAFSNDECRSGEAPSDKTALGARLFETHGVLQIDNAFPPELIQQLQQAFFERYEPYFYEGEHPDALYLGDKRYMLTVDLDELFGSDAVLNNPIVMPVLRRVLGDACVLGAFTAVISLPGSRDQRLHKDHPPLFPDTEWHHTLPSFAAQIIVPLIPLNQVSGTTRVYKGTHRTSTSTAEDGAHQDPTVPLGGCLITDYRCAHRGLGNRGDVVRPILTLIYNRRWFRDFKNYGQQPPLRVSEAAYAAMSEDARQLVDWWREELRITRLGQSQLLAESAGG